MNIGSIPGTGYIVQTSAGNFATRTFVAGTGISLTNPDGVSGATTITASGVVPIQFTEDSGTVAPSSGNINIFGTSSQGISTSGSGSTVTLNIANASSSQKGVASFNATNFTVTAGNVVANTQTLTAGTGLSGGGTISLGGSAITVSLSTPVSVANGGTGDTNLTLNGVLYGNGTSAVGVTAQGAANTVLLGNGGIPSFGAVPNGALQNSSITLSNGTNISVTGSPVSLGGTATINVAGPITPTSYISNGVLYGNGSSALQVTAQGAANTVLLGNGGVPSFGQVPNGALANSSITFVAGTNITLSPASPATVSLGGSLTINASGGGGGSSSTVQLYDDFFSIVFSASSKNMLNSQLGWTYAVAGSSGGTGVSTGTTGSNPGTIQFTGGGTGVVGGIILGDPISGATIPLGIGAITMNWIILAQTSESLTTFVGLGGQLPISSGGAIYFTSNQAVNSGNWQCVCTKVFGDGSTTTVNTSIAPSLVSFDHLQIIINAADTSVTFNINGVTAATITTNIPTVSLSPLAYMKGSTTGDNHIFFIDEFDLTLALTTPR